MPKDNKNTKASLQRGYWRNVQKAPVRRKSVRKLDDFDQVRKVFENLTMSTSQQQVDPSEAVHVLIPTPRNQQGRAPGGVPGARPWRVSRGAPLLSFQGWKNS